MCGASLVAAFSSCLCREAARPPGESGRPDGVDQQGRTWSYFNSKAARSSSAWPRERGFEHQHEQVYSVEHHAGNDERLPGGMQGEVQGEGRGESEGHAEEQQHRDRGRRLAPPGGRPTTKSGDHNRDDDVVVSLVRPGDVDPSRGARRQILRLPRIPAVPGHTVLAGPDKGVASPRVPAEDRGTASGPASSATASTRRSMNTTTWMSIVQGRRGHAWRRGEGWVVFSKPGWRLAPLAGARLVAIPYAQAVPQRNLSDFMHSRNGHAEHLGAGVWWHPANAGWPYYAASASALAGPGHDPSVAHAGPAWASVRPSLVTGFGAALAVGGMLEGVPCCSGVQ